MKKLLVRRIVLAVIFVFASLLSSISYAAEGVIALVTDDKIIIYDSSGGYSAGSLISVRPINVSRGDYIYGRIQEYGAHDFYDETADATMTIYIDEILLDADSALDYISQ